MSLSRFAALVGPDQVNRLRTRTVLVCGLGGVGSYACEALARSGLGRLVLADFDVVEPTDLNRQLIALRSTLGQRKVDVMKARIFDIDPAIDVVLHAEPIAPDALDPLFAVRPDYVVDAIDDVGAKVALIARCVAEGIPVVAAMGFANKLHPERVMLSTIQATSVCPLAKTVRLRLRRMGIDAKVPVVFSTEPPAVPAVPGVKLGSCAFVPSVAGLFAASQVINELVKEEGHP